MFCYYNNICKQTSGRSACEKPLHQLTSNKFIKIKLGIVYLMFGNK